MTVIVKNIRDIEFLLRYVVEYLTWFEVFALRLVFKEPMHWVTLESRVPVKLHKLKRQVKILPERIHLNLRKQELIDLNFFEKMISEVKSLFIRSVYSTESAYWLLQYLPSFHNPKFEEIHFAKFEFYDILREGLFSISRLDFSDTIKYFTPDLDMLFDDLNSSRFANLKKLHVHVRLQETANPTEYQRELTIPGTIQEIDIRLPFAVIVLQELPREMRIRDALKVRVINKSSQVLTHISITNFISRPEDYSLDYSADTSNNYLQFCIPKFDYPQFESYCDLVTYLDLWGVPFPRHARISQKNLREVNLSNILQVSILRIVNNCALTRVEIKSCSFLGCVGIIDDFENSQQSVPLKDVKIVSNPYLKLILYEDNVSNFSLRMNERLESIGIFEQARAGVVMFSANLKSLSMYFSNNKYLNSIFFERKFTATDKLHVYRNYRLLSSENIIEIDKDSSQDLFIEPSVSKDGFLLSIW